MKGLIAGIVVIAVVIGLFMIFNSDEPNLSPKKNSEQRVVAQQNIFPADKLFSMVGKDGLQNTGNKKAAEFVYRVVEGLK